MSLLRLRILIGFARKSARAYVCVCVCVRVCLFTNEQADDRYYVNGHEKNPHTIANGNTYENNSGQTFAALTLLIAESSISSRNQAPL